MNQPKNNDKSLCIIPLFSAKDFYFSNTGVFSVQF